VLDALSRDWPRNVILRAGQCFSRSVPKSYRTIEVLTGRYLAQSWLEKPLD
jgi:hypothetical protein